MESVVLVDNSEAFGSCQDRMLQELLVTIRDGLARAGLTDPKMLADTTWELAFEVASVVDGSRRMDVNGVPVLPVLTFARNRPYTELLHAKGGTWLHERIDEDEVARLCGVPE